MPRNTGGRGNEDAAGGAKDPAEAARVGARGATLRSQGLTRRRDGGSRPLRLRDVLDRLWHGGGLGLLVVGALLLLWALWLFLVHRRAEAKTKATGGPQSGSQTASDNSEAGRQRLFPRTRKAHRHV